MTTGITLQAQSPASASADLGFWLQSQVIGQPMAMTERHLTHLIETISANRFTLPRNRATGARITEKGTAIIEIHGVLINRAPIMGSFWGMSAYEGLTEQFRRLATNDDVKRIVLDIDSPGGMVTGIVGCSQALEELADKKPVFALAHDTACSAGYWLACIASELSVTADGEIGSIGVRIGHVSYAEVLDRAGIRVTNFAAGATKVDGVPSRLLGDGEAAEIQYDIDRTYDRFVAHVASHRPMSEADVRKTDARTFCGDDAVAGGLADRVESLEDMIARIESSAAKVKPKRKSKIEPGSKGVVAPRPERMPAVPDSDEPISGTPSKRGARLNMSETQNAAGASDLAAMITEALQPIVALKNGQAAPVAAAAPIAPAAGPSAAEAEQTRIFAIVESEEAKGRPAMATALAKAGLSADKALSILAAAPLEVSAAKDDKAADPKAELNNGLAAQMAKAGNSAGVKPEAAGAGARPSLADRIAAKHATKKQKV